MKIRQYTNSDYDSIKDWITDERTHAMWCANLTPFPLQRDSFNELLADFGARFGDTPFVATDDNGSIEGFFCLSLNTSTNESMLKFIMVDPDKRGAGLGKEMLRNATRHAFDVMNADAVQLNVFSENPRARKCYEGIGFKERRSDSNPFIYKDESWDRINMVMTKPATTIVKAGPDDLKEILDLQYLAYQSEAALFGNKDIPPLKQTLEEVQEEYKTGIILKMTDGNRIIGSVRALEKDGTVYIGKLMVHPDCRRRGYGKMLLTEIESYYPGKRYELFTSTRSKDNIRLYETLGYKQFDLKKIDDELQFVYLEKI